MHVPDVILLLFQIFMEILFHIFPFLFGQTFGSCRFIDCTCLGAQVCRVTQTSWVGKTSIPIFKVLISSVSGCSISLLTVQVPWSVTVLDTVVSSNVPLDWTHNNVTSEWLSFAHLVVWTQCMLEYHGLHVMGASCGSICPFDAASSALPVLDVLCLNKSHFFSKRKKQMVKKFLQFLEIALHLIPVLVYSSKSRGPCQPSEKIVRSALPVVAVRFLTLLDFLNLKIPNL